MSEDFYCDEVLSGRTQVEKVYETDNVLAYHHTRPFYPVHVVVIPKRHIPSLIALDASDDEILIEMLRVIKRVATDITDRYGASKVLTNIGDYQSNKHLHWHVVFGEAIR